ncbi:hypothetical protein C6503_26455 [Candidatus Poribacteria bacterium]|nr:MAG: hypothetical protein C6503_26455 [Candidatus Poribacteria bacterium]
MKFYQKILLCAILLLACWIRVQGVGRLPDNQFTSNDAYLYALQAQEIAEQNVLPARDMHRWLPEGRDNGQLLSLYAYAIVYAHKSIGWIFPELTLYHIQIYLPTLCFIIGLGVLCLFLARVFGFYFAATVILLLATLPGSIERSSVGFGDRDAWCWMFGIFAVISYLWKERMELGWRRWITTALCGAIVFLGGMSWEGFGFFLIIIIALELWKFCTTDTEDRLIEYVLWTLMFVPWLYFISPAYRSGYSSNTHLAAIMLFPPLVVLILRSIRYLLLTYVEQLRRYARKLAWGLTLLSIIAGVAYIITQASTFEETAYPFHENQFMQTIGELADPNFRYWWDRYGTIFVLGSVGLIAASLHLWKLKGIPMVVSLSLFASTTFFRDHLNGWVGEDTCNILFFVSLVLTVLSFGIASFRKEKSKNELVILAMLGWFFLWVGLSRGAVRHDFLVGMPLAYGTAWLLWFFPTHLIQKLKDMEIVYSQIREKQITTTIATTVLILVLFWTPLGGHAHRAIHAAARMRAPVPGQNSRAAAYQWMKGTLPQESVIAAHWNFGIQLNVLGDVGTIIDSDQFIKRIYLFYRHVCCAQDEQEVLSFLKTYQVTHLMLTEQDVITRSRTYSSIGSDENGDRQFSLYRLRRTETPIGTPYRMQPREQDTPLSFIDIARASPETLTITAQFKNENNTETEDKTDLDVKVQRTVSNPISQISVDIENGGVVLYFDSETKLQRAYYIPSIGWNSLAIKLFLRGEHSEAFVPVYPTDKDDNIDIKVWELRYPPGIEANEKYLTTKWEQTKTKKTDKK